MTVKVLTVVIIGLLCAVNADVSHLLESTPQSFDAGQYLDADYDTASVQPASLLRASPLSLGFQTNEVEKSYNGQGYFYEKPKIPFITGNLEHRGYDYPKPLNPFTYPPPFGSGPTTEQAFPDATARFRNLGKR